jgi:hypothetical protein
MYEIDQDTMSDAFRACWSAAGNHLNHQVEGGIKFWLRAHPYPPYLEHLSFRLGNQLFYVRVEDIDGEVQGPGNSDGFITAATGTNGVPCVLPMRQHIGGQWVAALPGWGLLDADGQTPIDPVALVTDQNIEMTPWEVQDLAVQVVCGALRRDGLQLMSWQSNPQVDPSIWFIGASGGPEWVVVRTARYPTKTATRPSNWEAIAEGCSQMSDTGHFASVFVMSAAQPHEGPDEEPVPMWRGHAMQVRFKGLESA